MSGPTAEERRAEFDAWMVEWNAARSVDLGRAARSALDAVLSPFGRGRHRIRVHVTPGTDPARVAREVGAAVEEFERAGGRRGSL